jgi:hypothetical protein
VNVPQAHFAGFLTPDGYHESGWKLGEHDPRA